MYKLTPRTTNVLAVRIEHQGNVRKISNGLYSLATEEAGVVEFLCKGIPVVGGYVVFDGHKAPEYYTEQLANARWVIEEAK